MKRTNLGQGPLVPYEEKVIKDILVGLIAEHGPNAVRWVWDKLNKDQPELGPAVKEAATSAATSAESKSGGGALLVLGALALAGSKKRGRRRR